MVPARAGQRQRRVNPEFWGLHGVSRPLWGMGAGCGLPDRCLGDLRVTQEGTVMPVQGSLGGTTWEP